MPHLLQDLIRLPLSEKLRVIEMALCIDMPSSMGFQDEQIHNLLHQLTEARNGFLVENESLASKMVFIKK